MKFTKWQQYNWNETIKPLIYGCITDVLIDGNPIVPKGRTPQFMAQFSRVQNNELTYIGYRLFSNDAQLRVSLSKWSDSLTRDSFFLSKGNGSLTFTYELEGSISKSIQLSKVWLDDEGKKHKAPWPSKEINKVSKAITEKGNGERKWAIPIGVGEPFEEDSTPEMSADVFVDRTEIIEIPEFTYRSKRSD
jgi:hypothetical protein